MGSAEWMQMIDQEIKELQRLIDRKAENQQIAKYMAAYGSRRKSFFRKIPGTEQNNGSSTTNDNSQNNQTVNSNNTIQREDASSTSSKRSSQSVYHFGHDLKNDFTTLFGAFNRVAKNKLDKTILSDFASVSFVDSLYEKKSIAFSSQLTDSYHLYYRLFDDKITNLSNRISEFYQNVINKLDEIDNLTKNLRNRLNRMFMIRRRHKQQEDEEESFDEIDANEIVKTEDLKTSRSESKLIPSSRTSHLELNVDSKKKFAKTIVIKRTPLMAHLDDS